MILIDSGLHSVARCVQAWRIQGLREICKHCYSAGKVYPESNAIGLGMFLNYSSK